jgi:hypothetical protein
MVGSSFSPVPGGEQKDQAAQRPRWVRRVVALTQAQDRKIGFSDYVSSRTVLAGGCPAAGEGSLVPPRRAKAE